MLEGMLIGLQTALSLKMILVVIGGCLIGTFIGMLPGLGPMSIIAIMIPVAISMGDPSAALILLAGVYYGAIFGGSTSSILLNAPGVAGTVATSFDGYPMTQKGKAGKALTIAAIASFCGGTIGAILLMIFAPMLSSVALLFHSAEYFALMVVGLSAIAAFAGTGQVAKAIMMTTLGLIMATVGEGALFNLPSPLAAAAQLLTDNTQLLALGREVAPLQHLLITFGQMAKLPAHTLPTVVALSLIQRRRLR